MFSLAIVLWISKYYGIVVSFFLYVVLCFVIVDLVKHKKTKKFVFRKLVFVAICVLLSCLNTDFFRSFFSAAWVVRLIQGIICIIYGCVLFSVGFDYETARFYDKSLPGRICFITVYTLVYCVILSHITVVDDWLETIIHYPIWMYIVKDSWKILLLFITLCLPLYVINIKKKHTFSNAVALALIPIIIINFAAGLYYNALLLPVFRGDSFRINYSISFFSLLPLLSVMILMGSAIIGLVYSVKKRKAGFTEPQEVYCYSSVNTRQKSVNQNVSNYSSAYYDAEKKKEEKIREERGREAYRQEQERWEREERRRRDEEYWRQREAEDERRRQEAAANTPDVIDFGPY